MSVAVLARANKLLGPLVAPPLASETCQPIGRPPLTLTSPSQTTVTETTTRGHEPFMGSYTWHCRSYDWRNKVMKVDPRLCCM